MVERKTVTVSAEKRLVTGLIVSDDYCKRVIPLLHKDYFESDFAAIIYSWCNKHFQLYKQSPGKNIQDIYRDRRGELEDGQRELVKEFLSQLSQKYEENDGGLNVDFEVDRATQWIRLRSAEVHAAKLTRALEQQKLDKFEEEVENFKKVVKPITGWVNPLDPDVIRMVFGNMDKNKIFQFPGSLGVLSGKLERGWLAAILAPWKRGKSFMLQEVSVISVMAGLKTAFFSLEMNVEKMERRILNRITAADPDQEGNFLYPVFDCLSNQDGTCKKDKRTNKKRLLLDNGERPKVEQVKNYKPCTECRLGVEKNDYKVSTWYVYRPREKMTERKAIRKAGTIQKMIGDNWRMKCYPMGAANMQTILSDLDALEYAEGFVPDVVVVDYADILAPEDSREREHRHRLDATWKALKRISEERHCLVFTASQGNRKSAEKKTLRGGDIAEDIRKVNHVDVMFALNQDEEDKAAGVMHISVVAHRHADFSEGSYVSVLQQRALSQVLLDQYMFWGIRQKDHFSKAINFNDTDTGSDEEE